MCDTPSRVHVQRETILIHVQHLFHVPCFMTATATQLNSSTLFMAVTVTQLNIAALFVYVTV